MKTKISFIAVAPGRINFSSTKIADLPGFVEYHRSMNCISICFTQKSLHSTNIAIEVNTSF